MTIISVTLAIIVGGMAILNAVLFWFMPRLSRRDLYFAVTVAPGFRDAPEGKSMLSRYRIELVIGSLAALIVFVAGFAWFGIKFAPAGIWIQVAASFIAFYRARQRALPSAVPPTMIREAELRNHDWIIPGGWIAAAGPFILLAVSATYFWIHGAGLWRTVGPSGRPSAHALGAYIISTAGILTAFSLMLYGLAHWVRPVYAAGPERVRELKFRRTVSALILLTEYVLAIQASWITLTRGHAGITVVFFPVFLVVILMIAVVFLARLGQGGSRIPVAHEDGPEPMSSRIPVGDRTLDRYWKLGVFYFNRDDSTVIVEKRFGVGYSLNFARPMAWFVIFLLLFSALIPFLAHFV
ncbi:MAG: hypothetical protein JO308_17225 [Verrucomicrobia bacterium]|nr:hypothetical protein [Verrucomicrobiota bacterium]